MPLLLERRSKTFTSTPRIPNKHGLFRGFDRVKMRSKRPLLGTIVQKKSNVCFVNNFFHLSEGLPSRCPTPLPTMSRMRKMKYRTVQEQWLAQALADRHCKTQVVHQMFRVLRSFFDESKQHPHREIAFSAATLEHLVLGSPVPMIQLMPALNPTQSRKNSRSTRA